MKKFYLTIEKPLQISPEGEGGWILRTLSTVFALFELNPLFGEIMKNEGIYIICAEMNNF